MNFHDKRVHTAFLILTSFLILISYRIISNIIAQNAETERIGQGQVAVAATSTHPPDLKMDNRLPLQTHRQLRYNELRLP